MIHSKKNRYGLREALKTSLWIQNTKILIGEHRHTSDFFVGNERVNIYNGVSYKHFPPKLCVFFMDSNSLIIIYLGKVSNVSWEM